MDDDSGDDPRSVELETLEAIFPELVRLDRFTFELHLPVEPAAPITVTFPAASGPSTASTGGSEPLSASSNVSAAASGSSSVVPGVVQVAFPEIDSREVSHLPSLALRIALPDGYPESLPPHVKVSTEPQWLSAEAVSRLEDDGPRLWEEAGRDMVAYTYIDHLQRAAEDVFGTVAADGTLAVHPDHKLAVLDYDIEAKKAAFEKETFECGICLDPKKGSGCHKMLDCGHIYCLQCLHDFYTDAIQQGSLETVRCLKPNCAKERTKAAAAQNKHGRKPKTSISPSELLQIGLANDMVKRYVTLKYKTELESDKNTIYCPRQWCNGAARSKKHKKPSGLEFAETSDTESDEDADDAGGAADNEAADGSKKKKKAAHFDRGDLLSVCEDCGYAFCSRCLQSWHGEYVICYPKRDDGELTAEEKASLEYIQLHTSPCPTCSVPAQKTHGCNHMICSRCNTHFCYLCSSWLDPDNPYKHYNTQPQGKITGCYMRLWELEEGDGDNVGLDFAGGRRPGAEPLPAPPEAIPELVPEIEEPGDDDSEPEEVEVNQQHVPIGQGIAVAREAPLVLRLMDNRPRQARHVQPPAPAPAGPGGFNVRGGNRGGALRRGAPTGRARGARGRGGRGGGAAAARPQNQGRIPANNEHQGGDAPHGGQGLDAAQEAWVRHFVQMALIDAEDLVEGDSDEEEGNGWAIR